MPQPRPSTPTMKKLDLVSISISAALALASIHNCARDSVLPPLSTFRGWLAGSEIPRGFHAIARVMKKVMSLHKSVKSG